MPEYEKTFKTVLKEYDIPSISRNRDDVKISDEVGDEAFNVDPMDANVGFRSNNMERDIGELKSILEKIGRMTEEMKNISETIASLGRSFNDIGKSSKTVANINQKLHDLNGELEGYIISLPAQKNEKENELGSNSIRQ